MSSAPNADNTLGAYVLDAPLGQGGMGTVYRARNRITGELRALKVIRTEHASNVAFRARFLREMRLAAAIHHLNVVQVYEPAMEGDALLLPMEFVDGPTLRERLTGIDGRPQALPLDETLAILAALCDGVAAIHAHGVIHRDLKPGNVLLARGADGVLVPKILDFGAAKALIARDDEEQTDTGVAIGTVFYMAPEQAMGRRDIDARADVYALGVIAYQLLTGRRPYESDEQVSALVRLLRREPFPTLRELVPTIPLAVGSAVMGALRWERDARVASAADFAAALRAVDIGASVSTAEPSPEPLDSALVEVVEPDSMLPVERGASPPRVVAPRRRAWAVVALAALVAIAVLTARRPSPLVARAVSAPLPASAPRPPSPPPTPAQVEPPVTQPLTPPPETALVEAPPVDASAQAEPAPAPRRTRRSRRHRRHRCRPSPGVVCPPEGF